MKAHEVLALTLDKLKQMNDQALKQAYLVKMEELDNIRIIELEVYESRKKELEDAFNALNTANKRLSYIQDLNQPQAVMTSVKANEQTTTTHANTFLRDLDQSVKKYQSYVDSKINKLDPEKPSYQEDKEKLEKHKNDAEPKTENYASFEDFKKSDCYQSMSGDEQKKYSDDAYPSKVTHVTYTFDSAEEALKFVKDNMSIEIAKDIARQFQEKGVKINSEVLKELHMDEHKPSNTSANRPR